MKINGVSNIGFGMPWADDVASKSGKLSEALLTKIGAQKPEKIKQAMGFVDYIESNSPHHTVFFLDKGKKAGAVEGDFIAIGQMVPITSDDNFATKTIRESIGGFGGINGALKRLMKGIDKQNEKVQARLDLLNQSLELKG